MVTFTKTEVLFALIFAAGTIEGDTSKMARRRVLVSDRDIDQVAVSRVSETSKVVVGVDCALTERVVC